MTESERVAIAARLHVALRRKTGRVTDTEWLAINVEYAAEIVRFARAHAAEAQDEELAAIAARFEFAMEPLALAARAQAARAGADAGRSASGPAPRYVGGIR